jgi:hypothetical protein
MIVLLVVFAACAEERQKVKEAKKDHPKKANAARKPAKKPAGPGEGRAAAAKDRPVVAAKKKAAAKKEPKDPQKKKKIATPKKPVKPPKPTLPEAIVPRQQPDAEKAKFRKAKRSGVRPMMAIFLASGTVVGVIVILAVFQRAFRRHPERLPNALQS